MSRSNPTVDIPNPSTRWFEWDGSNGNIRFYDKEAKKNVTVQDGFTFLLLEETACVKGWNEQTEKGIYSNEVKNTVNEPFVVKEFKGGLVAQGFYAQIKDRVAACGGHFVGNLYLAFKDKDGLQIGALQLKGAGLNAWLEFRGRNRGELYKKAVQIKGSQEGKKGKVVFKTPVFHLKDVAPETDKAAIELDKQLQEYLTSYFARTKASMDAKNPPMPAAPAEAPAGHSAPSEPPTEPEPDYDHTPELPPEEDNDVPF